MSGETETHHRALEIRGQLEAINDALYLSIRATVQQGTRPGFFSQLLSEDAQPVGGLGFDYLDELLAGFLQLKEPYPLPAHPAEGMVFYQPTPARHIFHLLRLSQLDEADTLIDLGSGLGHVPLLTAICTNAGSIGIEREEAYVASARRCAEQLKLGRVAFLPQDARDADLSAGTVFYLYTPFSGAILEEVLSRLQEQSKMRCIRICTFGPCTKAVAQEKWLAAITSPDEAGVSIFRSRG